ncbi:hypothetical protein MTR67_039260 [Solanum verrucosum]|uniref:SWIM-type domain-containing protein n=1 Tax=Solanum verrucosum TaxID=315347 RepID=A0AAF0ZQH6_SOLVR|nr:hypothetical protein MTR67_039260 [Solanum verrucosum]
MDRNVEMRKFVDTWISDISPRASLVLEENKDSARDCQVRFNGQFGYEILDGHYRHNIDIRTKTCTCRTWHLRGIPSQHVVLAYQHAGQDPEDHVVHWYRKDTFIKAYNYFIPPIPNMKMWPHTSDIVIKPPEPKQMSGRPPKYRRKSKDEPRKNLEAQPNLDLEAQPNLDLEEEFNKMEETWEEAGEEAEEKAGGEKVMILQLLQEVNKQEEK